MVAEQEHELESIQRRDRFNAAVGRPDSLLGFPRDIAIDPERKVDKQPRMLHNVSHEDYIHS
jgi:hypothetical protein